MDELAEKPLIIFWHHPSQVWMVRKAVDTRQDLRRHPTAYIREILVIVTIS